MIGFIGGSGIYEALALDDASEERVETPFGDPSAPLSIGRLGDRDVAFLPRHGRNHQLSPSEVPYRANVYAFKRLGVERIVASNAVGSLREDCPPRTIVVPDQIFDRTRTRTRSFFEGEKASGIVVHMGFADPYCDHLSDHLETTAREELEPERRETGVVGGGTYVCIEGPQFSTRAESEFYRSQGFDLVGMTAIPEAKLAREAGLCYGTLAGVTDFDVWHDDPVSLGDVLETAEANREAITRSLRRAIETMPETRECGCADAIEGAINTPMAAIPEATRERLALLIDEHR